MWFSTEAQCRLLPLPLVTHCPFPRPTCPPQVRASFPPLPLLPVSTGGPPVSLAPLRFGAGIKGKILDSWHWGLPVVSTVIGSEGLGWINGSESGDADVNCRGSAVEEQSAALSTWGGIGDIYEEDALASGAVRLYSDEHLWKDCQRQVC